MRNTGRMIWKKRNIVDTLRRKHKPRQYIPSNGGKRNTYDLAAHVE